LFKGIKDSFGAPFTEKEGEEYIDKCYGEHSWKGGMEVSRYRPIVQEEPRKASADFFIGDQFLVPNELTSSNVRLDKSEVIVNNSRGPSVDNDKKKFDDFLENMPEFHVQGMEYMRLDEDSAQEKQKHHNPGEKSHSSHSIKMPEHMSRSSSKFL
jgi:hypothetical protein